MTWARLSVVAVENIVGDLGCAVRAIIVRTGRRTAVLHDAMGAQPLLGQAIHEREFDRRVAEGLWCRVTRPWQARRGCLALVSTASFRRALLDACGPSLPTERELGDGLLVTYRPREELSELRTHAARALLAAATDRIEAVRPQAAAALLDQARFVCDRGSVERLRLYAAYQRAVAADVWEALSIDATDDLGLEGRSLTMALERAWGDLRDEQRRRAPIIERPAQRSVEVRQQRRAS